MNGKRNLPAYLTPVSAAITKALISTFDRGASAYDGPVENITAFAASTRVSIAQDIL
jgi:hypothetical protein